MFIKRTTRYLKLIERALTASKHSKITDNTIIMQGQAIGTKLIEHPQYNLVAVYTDTDNFCVVNKSDNEETIDNKIWFELASSELIDGIRSQLGNMPLSYTTPEIQSVDPTIINLLPSSKVQPFWQVKAQNRHKIKLTSSKHCQFVTVANKLHKATLKDGEGNIIAGGLEAHQLINGQYQTSFDLTLDAGIYYYQVDAFHNSIWVHLTFIDDCTNTFERPFMYDAEGFDAFNNYKPVPLQGLALDTPDVIWDSNFQDRPYLLPNISDHLKGILTVDWFDYITNGGYLIHRTHYITRLSEFTLTFNQAKKIKRVILVGNTVFKANAVYYGQILDADNELICNFQSADVADIPNAHKIIIDIPTPRLSTKYKFIVHNNNGYDNRLMMVQVWI